MILRQLFRTEPVETSLTIAGRLIPFDLRVNRKARRLIVRVDQARGTVVVIAPSKRDLKEAARFAERHKDWIAARLNEIPRSTPFEVGERVPFRGERHLIVHRPEARRGVWREEGAELLLCASGAEGHVERRIGEFLKREARRLLGEETARLCASLAIPRPKISLRDPATRWGSCSRKSGISYSWRLVFAPDGVLTYVVAHEVAHLVHMNHSPAFWRLVGDLHPEPAAAIAWLRREGRALHRLGRATPIDRPDPEQSDHRWRAESRG